VNLLPECSNLEAYRTPIHDRLAVTYPTTEDTAVEAIRDVSVAGGVDLFRARATTLEGRRRAEAHVGHGYRPWLACVWAVAVIAAFALVVWHWTGMLVPEQQEVTGSPQPVAYAADAFLPIVDLGEAGDWMPIGWLRWAEWSAILLGWALSTLFVAGFTRIVRSE